MHSKYKLITIFIFSLISLFSITAIVPTDVSAGTIRCAYGRCKNDAGCDNGGKCIDMNGDGLKECSNGICNTNADCYGAQNGGAAVCRDENGDGLKECANAFCPIGKTIPGANCDCSAGRTCGQTCNASVGLCEDDISSCRYIVGKACTRSQPNSKDTTYCVPDEGKSGGAIETNKCVGYDQYNSYALLYGANPTVAQLAALCSSLACSATDPGKATLNAPANNSNITTGTDATLAYDVNTSGWGIGCPQNNSWNVQYTKVVPATGLCGATWSNLGATNKIQSIYYSAGDTVCWRVVKNNGTNSSISDVSKFKVVDSVKINSGGIKADVCGGGFSGVAGVTGVSNPIDYSLTFTTQAGNTYKEVWLAMVPDQDVYNSDCAAFNRGDKISNGVCQSQESSNVQDPQILLGKVKNSGGVAFKILLDLSGNAYQMSAYNGTTWVAQTATGADVSGLGGTLQGFKTGSYTVIQGLNLSANFKIKFDSVPLGKFAFFTAAVIIDPQLNIRSSSSTSTSPFVYTRVGAFGSAKNWGIDLVPPTAVSQFFTPKYANGNQFNFTWGVKEANALVMKSFITSDVSGAQLNDSVSGAINFGIALPDVNAFNNGTLNIANINPWNGYVTESSLGTRTYVDADSSKQSNYQFYEFAKDVACNQKVSTASAAVQKPWILSYSGDLSAAKGITGVLVPSALDQLSDTLKDSANNTLLSDKQSAYLSTYSTITGNGDMPLRKQSKLQQYITNYQDLTIKPPFDSGFTKWFDYMADLLTKNQAPVDNSTYASKSATVANTTSSFLGIAAGVKKHILIGGNLVVNANAVCDTQTIFLVKGTITFTPSFKVNGNNNGCIFVSVGDITIANVSGRSSGSGLIDSTSLASYDLIEAALLTDAQFITNKDIPANDQKGFGLMIKGSVVSENVTLQRDVNLNANQLQPAHVFYFDPRYREIFKSDLNYNKYSLREIGYTSN